MAFNPQPNKQAVEVLFSPKTNIPNYPPLFFNGSTVFKGNVYKHIGLNLDPKLSFVTLMKKINKAKKIIGILKYLLFYFLFFIYIYIYFVIYLCIFFSGTKHPREDNPNLYYWAEITGLHTQTFNI